MKKYLGLVGLVTAIVSVVLAVYIKFDHFYEYLLFSLFLVLYAIGGQRIGRRIYTYMYLAFAGSGFVGDYIMGVHQAKLWHYTSFHGLNLAILYVVAYPLAGIVMVQSYDVILHTLSRKADPDKITSLLGVRYHALLFIVLFAAFIGTTARAIADPIPAKSVLSYVSAALLAAATLSLMTARRHHPTLLDVIRHSPNTTLFAMIVATYGNAFLHEFPNTYAHEWVYTNYPLPGMHVFNIPLVILIGWPLLLFFPLSVYYLLRESVPSSMS